MKSPLGRVFQRLAGSPPGRAVLRVAMRLVLPRNLVGAVGAIVDGQGRVLVARHSYRTDFPWGLPGGLVQEGEHPAAAVAREIAEELRIEVRVEQLLLCDTVPMVERGIVPPHLGLAYLCRPVAGTVTTSHEILSIEWLEPGPVSFDMAPFQARALEAAWAAAATRSSGGEGP